MDFQTVERLRLSGWFGAGVLLQALFLVRGSWDWKRFFGSILAGFFGMLPGKHEHEYDASFHILFSFGVFSVAIANFFRDEILPKINEAVLLSYSLTFLFSFISFFNHGNPLYGAFLVLASFPMAGVLFIAFCKTRLNFFWKVFFYSWYMCVTILLGLFQFRYGTLSVFFSDNILIRGDTWGYVSSGMAFLYLVVNATYLFELIPIPGKHQTWADRMREWHELTSLMTQRYDDDEQLSYMWAALIILLQGGLYFLDYRYRFVDANILMTTLILLPMVMLAWEESAHAGVRARRAAGQNPAASGPC